MSTEVLSGLIFKRRAGARAIWYSEGVQVIIGNLSKDVFERRTSTGSEAFSLLICLDAIKFVLLSFFSLIKTIYPRVSTEPLPNDAKSPLPVDVRLSKTLLLKLHNDLKLLPPVADAGEGPGLPLDPIFPLF